MHFVPPSDYQLDHLLGENTDSNVWLAEQVSVRRKVVLEQLRDLDSPEREHFIASVRAKASVDHPLIASVYEAINDEHFCLFAREWLHGQNLAALIQQGVRLKPPQLAHIIKRIAEACMHWEERGTATETLTISHIYLNEQNVLRISNLAQAGMRSENASARDMAEIGSTLTPLLADGESGLTRIQTLLYWMTGQDSEHILNWKEVRYYADQIEQQLATPVIPMQTSHQPEVKPKRNSLSPILITAVATVLIAVIAVFFISRKTKTIKPNHAELLGPILIPEGDYQGPDGNRNRIRKFWMSSHEVTIGQYSEFLDFVKVLEGDQRKIFDHESQPPSKVSHEVEDWSNILSAAQKGQVWKNRVLTLHSPIFGVDWWDAHAYCEWKRARLPSQEEWYAALTLQTQEPDSLKPRPWGDVQSFDQNGAGFLGLAGGVSEWTRRPASDPTNPLGARKWVIIGASFANPTNGAKAREWTNNRDLRRDDVGFRIAYDHLPD